MVGRMKFDMEELKKINFDVDDRSHLEKAHVILFGYMPDETEENKEIRERLQQVTKATEVHTTNSSPPAQVKNIHADTPESPLSLKVMPNLTANGRWGGRWMAITWIQDKKDPHQVQTARWETMQQDVIANVRMEMPYPLYHNFVGAQDIELRVDYEIAGKGRRGSPEYHRMIRTEETITTPKYNVLEHGPVPGTEHLPISYLDYFQQVAKKTNCFRNVTRSLLIKMYNILFGTTPMSELTGVTDQDLRVKIAQSLGPEYEQMLTEELFGAAASA